MDVPNLIIDDRKNAIFRVHRTAMTSQEVFELEQRNIFDRCWLYVGHESELPNPGDYRRRHVAGRPIVFVRGSDSVIRLFFNTCTHRGARICRQDAGNQASFQCFYHSWTFNNKGELVGVPDEESYAGEWNRKERALQQPARSDNYRGFWFLSFNPDMVDLDEYLAGAKEYLDLVADQSEVGMRLLPGTNRYATNANWKLLVENSLDGYHGAPLHVTYWQFLAKQGLDRLGQLTADTARGLDLGNGHAVTVSPAPYGRPVALWHPTFGEDAREEIASIRQRLIDRHGEDRAYRMTETIRNLFVYPNLIINDVMAITVRVIWSISPNQMDVTAWALGPAEESSSMLKRRIEGFNLFLGPGGFGSPDDVEALEACQEGFAATAVEWSDISRGMRREATAIDERQVRALWREWHAHLQGLPHGDHSPDYQLAAQEAASSG
jgi:p-cumate 2,3-dioxygenase alpha subunit